MNRTPWLLLAIGAVLVLVFSMKMRVERDDEAAVEAPDTELGMPDLVMDTAEITQFRPDGTLHYRLRADRITHYPDAAHTLLAAPLLTLYDPGRPPWRVTAATGRVVGSTRLLESVPGEGDTATPIEETVTLETDVRIQRPRLDGQGVELSTEQLTLYPGREYAVSERPVMIRTLEGRTTAAGLEADLAAGRFVLEAGISQRVHSTLLPGTIR
ncbi:MAG: LPS export ABC transporter periplasmic protein LptC [Pseudomonadales bacterium]|jgi:lipopolysaccharide export system protein LptC|nr:LPS export ABC transporter periplasmic protein LptC [Pseudomonadales bacterium]